MSLSNVPDETLSSAGELNYAPYSPPWSDRAGLLTALALERLKAKFAKHSHSPSPAAWAALEALIAAMEEAAKGNLERQVFLSALDPGVGKSSAIAAFLDALLSFEDFAHVGVILCVSRLEEIERFVSQAGIPSDWFAVYTSDESLNALGLGKANASKARVLFTTHAMTERLCNGMSFADVDALKFNGKPRQVRLWDESLTFGRGVTLAVDDIAALFRRFSVPFPKVRKALEETQAAISQAKDGALYVMPDLEATTGASANDVARLLSDNEEDRRVATALWFLSGRTVTIRRDGAFGNTALDYQETLPPDIKPIIVTDASGRVRSTYTTWEETRGDLVRLPTAPKTYGELTCRVWRTSGAKSAFAKREAELSEGVANAINERPDRDILVLVHKAKAGRYDVEKAIRGLVKGDQSRVHFLNWGSHTAVNRYSHCSTVIGAGTLFYRASTIEGLARSAKGLSSKDGRVSREELREIELGESRHNLLQGACRGSVRRSVGDSCPPSELLLIASEASGIPASLSDVFPGCRVLSWRPLVRPLEGKLKLAADYLKEWAELASGGDFLPFKVVQSRVGVSNVTTFYRTIRSDEDLRAIAAELGLSEAPRKAGGKYPQGWRMIDFGETTDPEGDQKRERERRTAEELGDY